jgi:WD40 repeat protein
MDEYNRTLCLENTRRNVINDIMEWIEDDSNDSRKVLWVYGLAGSGKSTLSTTIAQIMRRIHRLGAFFFFNRDIPQRNFATLIRTLAYRLAMFDVCFGVAISQVVEKNDNIAEMPLEFQFESLLSANALKSVEWSGGPILLIIDALDECGSEADRKVLMKVLSKGFSTLPSFLRIMVVSRQEQDIQRVLGSHSHLCQYPLDIDSVTNEDDVLEYIRHRLEEIRIKNGRLGDHWPGDDKIRALANRAGGLFIWASTACLYIESYAPNRRLSELVDKQPEVNSSGPFAQLDSLYETGLHSAGLWYDALFCSDCCNILGTILCARVPLSCSVIDTLLRLPQDRSSWESVSRLGCVLHVSETEPIRTLHPSFHDYLSERCRSHPWSIDLEHHNKELAIRCIKLLDKELRENMCDMTLPYLSQKRTLPEAISYACKFWIEHICLISDVTDDLVNRTYVFLAKHLLHWIEVLAILKCHDHTIRSIDNLIKWLRVCRPISAMSSRSETELYQLLYDGYRFSRYFANTIKVHPLLLYTTALPFTPTNTIIFQTFYHSGLPKVVCGVDKMWPPELLQLRGHDRPIQSVAFSPDGSKIISGSFDKTIRVWDASTGIEMLPPLRGHNHRINSVAFSPDGSTIISGSDDNTIRVWDAGAGIEMLPPLRGHDYWINSVAFSPDGSKIISGSSDRTVRVWDPSTGIEILPPLRGHDDEIRSAAFSPDGSKIISGSNDKTVRVWDASTGIEMLPPLRGHDDLISCVTFSPDGSNIISGSKDKTVRVWDTSAGIEMLPPLRGHNDWVSCVAFSPDGSTIISGSDDKTIRVWDASTGIEMLPPLWRHDDEIRCVAFSPDGSKIISGSFDQTIRVWDASTGIEMLPSLRGHEDWIDSVAFSPDGSKIISGSDDNTIRVWDASTGIEMLPPLRGHDSWINSVAFSPDGSKIISGSGDKTIRVWDATIGIEMVPPLRGHDSEINSIALSPDGSKIISSHDKTIRVWDASTGVEMLPPLRGHDSWINSVAFSPDGSKIISGSGDKTIRVWDASTGIEILPPLRGHDNSISSVAFSPDGSKIISGSEDKTIRVWDASTGIEMFPPLRGHDSYVRSVAFSHDGSTIVSRSEDKTIRVWDASTGIEMVPPPSRPP